MRKDNLKEKKKEIECVEENDDNCKMVGFLSIYNIRSKQQF